MFRPRLRTTDGCLTCRKRRKRCSMEKPQCRNCSRHSLKCNWSTQPAQHILTTTSQPAVNISTVPALLCYQVGPLANGWQSFHSETQLQLTLACPGMITAILSLPDITSYMLEGVQISLLLSEPLVRSSMAAFATGMLCKRQEGLKSRAIEYYLDGIRNLKSLFQSAAGYEHLAVKLTDFFP